MNKTSIKPQEFPSNATVCYAGRGFELLTLIDRLRGLVGNDIRNGATWGSVFDTPYHRKRVRLLTSVEKHAIWYFKQKYPNMTKMYWTKFRNGYLFYNASHYDNNN